MQRGETLIDIRGGWTDRRKTLEVSDDTLFAVFSSGKAAAALVIAWLVEEDRIGYDQLVSTIWSDFAQAGKEHLTIGQIMSHQSGLSGITASGYHPVTYGFLAGEIAQRADSQHRTLGQILRDELCQPGDADVWIGLPPTEHARCADMQKPKSLPDMGEMTEAKRWAFLKPWSSPGGMGAAAWREAELAGSNCHATARGLATLMQLPFEIDFAAGVMRNAPNYFYGPNPSTLGHSGWGGSCVFGDPVTGLHGAYVMNRQRNSLLGDIRPRALIDEVYANL